MSLFDISQEQLERYRELERFNASQWARLYGWVHGTKGEAEFPHIVYCDRTAS